MARKLTILHVFSTFAVGGPQRRFAELAKALPGYTHIIAAMDGDHTATSLLDGVDYRVQDIEIRKGGAIDVGNVVRLRRLLRSSDADILCTYNWGSMEAVVANKMSFRGRILPHVHFEDGFGPDETPGRQLPRRVQARRLLLKSAEVVVPSNTLKSLADKRWQLSRIHYIPNGIDTARFVPVAGTPKESVLIGSIGALRPEKNFARLIEGFAAADLGETARLMIAGDGPDLERLETLALSDDIADRIDFPGHVEEPAGLLRLFDVFAMSSDTEQMPLSLLEAMATGLPVVATDVGDCKEMVSEENREYIVPVDDEAAYARALTALASDPDLRQRLGAANRERVQSHYDRSVMVKAYDRLFRDLTDKAA